MIVNIIAFQKQKHAILLFFFLFLIGCHHNASNPKRSSDRIQVYYTRSMAMDESSCDYDFEALERSGDIYGSIYDTGSKVIKNDDYDSILNYIKKLKNQPLAVDSNYKYSEFLFPLHFQANFYTKDSLVHRICIDYDNFVRIDGRVIVKSDTLVYLLRKYANFYNYTDLHSEDSITNELKKFKLPEDFHDLSKEKEMYWKAYNKIVVYRGR